MSCRRAYEIDLADFLAEPRAERFAGLRTVAVADGRVARITPEPRGEGGVFWRQAESIAQLPCIPLFYGGEQVYQTLALEDLCQGVARVLEDGIAGRFGLAEVEPVRLRDVYAEVARAVGKQPRFLRLPGAPLLMLLRLFEGVGFRLPISSDNLLGLKHLRAFDLADDVRRLGLSPRTAQESLAGLRWNRIARS